MVAHHFIVCAHTNILFVSSRAFVFCAAIVSVLLWRCDGFFQYNNETKTNTTSRCVCVCLCIVFVCELVPSTAD